ncbi:MAG: magnesium transporter [Phycisphaerae bacterium]|nr:magnesium transporter [Phycisphaerae bacterium]MCZ2398396.1 magnesium transporter [Phycisphaerae bacterium]NUQ48990.1 magnesium transporter [Phycisphaerae bacterium]
MTPSAISHEELAEAWPVLSLEERLEGFALLSRVDAEELFLRLDSHQQAELLMAFQPAERRAWIRLLPPDDAADLVQEVESEARAGLLEQLDDQTRREVVALLAYAEDAAGGLMNPRFARLRPDMSVDAAILYLRRQTREHVESIYYAYVLDAGQKLLGVVSLRELMTAAPTKVVRDVMTADPLSVPEDMDQEQVSHLFAEHNLMALPVVDAEGRMKGIVSVDDIVDVVREEATEDIQKLGAMEALGAPYLEVGFRAMIKKRGGWLSALFIGEMLTATAMGHFEHEIEKAVVLAMFVPLIISSGGNSGSQAATLIVRSLALRELRLRDWLRVLGRELRSGLTLGAWLGAIGFLRVMTWQHAGFYDYGPHYLLVAATVWLSLIGVVLFGTLAGSMLPFVLRRVGFDPATSSAPFVATLVDVTGIVIYFEVASLILRGTLL